MKLYSQHGTARPVTARERLDPITSTIIAVVVHET